MNTFLANWKMGPTVVGFIALSLTADSAVARYAIPDLEKVPVDRLVENLEQRLKQDTDLVATHFHLARLHAMAHALKVAEVDVLKGREDHGAWLGHEPSHVPPVVVATTDAARLEEAEEHLHKALTHYVKVMELSPDHLAAQLGHGWCLEQAGQSQGAIEQYRQVIDAAWSKEKKLRRGALGARYITSEAAVYLIPLLDEKEDKQEIDRLRERRNRLESLPRPVTPVVVPLRDGLTVEQIVDHAAHVAFDADGSGLQKTWSWITEDAGWLVYDPSATGRVTSGLQMFGEVTFWLFWENGYQPMAALDDDGDGLLKGDELRDLAIWRDVDRDGFSDSGEVEPLAAWGIVAVSCREWQGTGHPDVAAYSPRGVVLRDGRSRPSYDIVLHPSSKAGGRNLVREHGMLCIDSP